MIEHDYLGAQKQAWPRPIRRLSGSAQTASYRPRARGRITGRPTERSRVLGSPSSVIVTPRPRGQTRLRLPKTCCAIHRSSGLRARQRGAIIRRFCAWPRDRTLVGSASAGHLERPRAHEVLRERLRPEGFGARPRGTPSGGRPRAPLASGRAPAESAAAGRARARRARRVVSRRALQGKP
jgi:hypothetical protein